MTDMIRTKLIEAHIDNIIKAAVNEHILP